MPLDGEIYRHQVLPNPEDVGPLKALIAYDALVHPDHPLRKQGIDGIELFMGEQPVSQPYRSHWANCDLFRQERLRMGRLVFSSLRLRWNTFDIGCMRCNLRKSPSLSLPEII